MTQQEIIDELMQYIDHQNYCTCRDYDGSAKDMPDCNCGLWELREKLEAVGL